MAKTFTHLNRTWQAMPTGTGHSVGVVGVGGAMPEPDRWGVIIRPEPASGAEYRARISKPDPADSSDEELRTVLEEQLVLASINSSRYVWRPAEAIATELKMTVDRVLHILENSSEVVAGDRNQQGRWLYTTENHLSRTSGDVLRQMYDVEESS